MGRHIYATKPPKQRTDFISSSKITARALLHSLSISKNIGPVASRQISNVCPPSVLISLCIGTPSSTSLILLVCRARAYAENKSFNRPGLTALKMGPRDSRGSTKQNGNVDSAGKERAEAKISRNPSTVSLTDLTQEKVDEGIAALRQMSRIFYFVQGYQQEISDVESIYDLGIRQQKKIDELDTMVTDLTWRKNKEMTRLLEENDTYRANVHQFEQDRKELESEKSSINNERTAMESEMQRQKRTEIDEAKQQFFEEATAEFNWRKEELKKKMKTIEREKKGLEDTIKALKEKNVKAQKDLSEQKESSEIDKRSSQSHIKQVESELHQIKALSKFSPQTPAV